jgi:hypothetical protein
VTDNDKEAKRNARMHAWLDEREKKRAEKKAAERAKKGKGK